MDLNKTEFQAKRDIVFIDPEKMLAGFDCGCNVLYEDVQQGHYLTYLAIYDLNQMKLLKVLIKNTGYFME